MKYFRRFLPVALFPLRKEKCLKTSWIALCLWRASNMETKYSCSSASKRAKVWFAKNWILAGSVILETKRSATSDGVISALWEGAPEDGPPALLETFRLRAKSSWAALLFSDLWESVEQYWRPRHFEKQVHLSLRHGFVVNSLGFYSVFS